MKPFITFESHVAPLDRNNVDTDAIIPKQFLKSIKRSGFGVNAFDEWRYLDVGYPGQDCSKRPINTDFSLNQPLYKNAQILLTRSNFGCGSSREHAPWALEDYGFKAIIASSFADIFFNNCYKNGLLPIILSENDVEKLFNFVEQKTQQNQQYKLKIDLQNKVVVDAENNLTFEIKIDDFRRECLLNGWDDIGLTLRHKDEILAFENNRKQQKPWLYVNGK